MLLTVSMSIKGDINSTCLSSVGSHVTALYLFMAGQDELHHLSGLTAYTGLALVWD